MQKIFSDRQLEDFVQETLEQWHVPGLGLAVVNADELILCDGFGFRSLSESLPVTGETLFPIASCTKAFTAMSAGMLVDAGQLDWDEPIREYLPTFKLWDAFASERMTVRDLLCHRSGLPGHDMLWYGSNFSRQEIFKRLRYLEPSRDFRNAFQYQNLMYTVAGMLVEQIAGTSWEQFVKRRIFEPLGMNRSNFFTDAIQPAQDFALPYLYRDGQLREMPFLNQPGEVNAQGLSGGIVSCASEMAKWLQLHLNHGEASGQTLISTAGLEQILTPQIFINDPLARERYRFEFNSYGLGWGMHTYRGYFLVEHDGMTDGFYALVSLLPRHGLGVVALSNCDAYYNPAQDNLAPNVITYTLYDRLLSLQPVDWNARMRAVQAELSAAIAGNPEQADAEKNVNAPPSHPIEAYLGDYRHPGYGVVSIRRTDGQLQMVLNDKLILRMQHYYYDVFEVFFETANQRQKIAFMTDLQGKVARIAAQLEPRVNEIIFNRLPGQ